MPDAFGLTLYFCGCYALLCLVAWLWQRRER